MTRCSPSVTSDSAATSWKTDMPLYEYKCKDCGHHFDRLQRVDAEAPPCPNVKDEESSEDGKTLKQTICGGETKRQISRTSFQLKGGGWADTGYS